MEELEEYKKNGYRKTFLPKNALKSKYRRYLCLDGYLNRDTDMVKETLGYFNDKENKDGSLATLIINTHRFREGISIFGAGTIHVIGSFRSAADMYQSVARGIRNCGGGELPYIPYTGRRIQTFIYRPVLDQAYDISLADLAKIISASSQDKQTVNKELQTLFQGASKHRLLFKVINEESRKINELFKSSAILD